MHTTRTEISKKIPIARKGTKYIVTSLNYRKQSIPLLIIIRDILKLAKSRKEAKKILNSGEVIVNNKIIKTDRFSVLLFDNITLKSLKRSYKLLIGKRKKFELMEINYKDANHKICKIIGKKILKDKKIQLNLNDGRNFLISLEQAKKIKTGTSVLVDLENNKVEKYIIPKENSKVFIFRGSHIGNFARIEKIYDKKTSIKIENKIFDIPIKDLIVIENE